MTDQAKEQSGQDDQSQKFVIKVDGKEVELTQDQITELAQKGQDYTNKTQKLSEEKKALDEQKGKLDNLVKLQEEITGDPKLEKAVTEIINKHRAGVPVTQKSVDKASKKLDQLIQESDDPSQRENLKLMREIISEETGTSALKEQLEKANQEIEFLKKGMLSNVDGRVDEQINKLESRYGKDLIDKYRPTLKAAGKKYTSYLNEKDFPRLLFQYADQSEMEESLLKSAQEKKKKEIEKKENGSFPGGDSSPKKLEPKRDKAGRVLWGETIKQMKEAGHFLRK